MTLKMREKGEDTAISVRLSKDEWEDIKSQGDTLFKNRSVGYMQVVPNNFHFDKISPFYKDFRDKDNNDEV